MSNYSDGGLRIVNVNLGCKAVLIGCLFRFYDPDERECPWHQRMRYYAARLIGINDNTRRNCDIPTPFYSHFVRVLHEFSVHASQPKPSKVYYMGRFKFTVTPVEARCENIWNQYFGPGVIWKDVWKDSFPAAGMIPCCAILIAGCRSIVLVVVLERKLYSMFWFIVLRLKNYGCASFLCPNVLILRLLDFRRRLVIKSASENSPLGRRGSHTRKSTVVYFKNYVPLRLEMKLSSLPIDAFLAKWAVNNVLVTQMTNSVHILV